MRDLEGDKACDKFIKEELLEAGIDIVKADKLGKIVPYTIIGKIGNWIFERYWSYWIASNEVGPGVPSNNVKSFNGDYGNEVRLNGYCTCLTFEEWRAGNKYAKGATLYHIDTQVGLNAFAELLNKLKENPDYEYVRIIYR